MLSVKEFKKYLDNRGESELTLTNDNKDSFTTGQPDGVVKVGSKLRLHWTVKPNEYHKVYDVAILHKDDEILLANYTTPINIGPDTASIELSFDI